MRINFQVNTLRSLSVGDNSVGTRKRAIEAIMEFKKKKAGEENHRSLVINLTYRRFKGKEMSANFVH